MNWLKLSSRERDAVVAIQLGWKSWPYAVINGTRRDFETWVPPSFVKDFDPDKPHGGCVAGQLPPSYTTSMDCAWIVVEAMADKGWTLKLESEERVYPWMAFFNKPNQKWGYSMPWCPTAPEAICLAALRAMGVEG